MEICLIFLINLSPISSKTKVLSLNTDMSSSFESLISPILSPLQYLLSLQNTIISFSVKVLVLSSIVVEVLVLVVVVVVVLSLS